LSGEQTEVRLEGPKSCARGETGFSGDLRSACVVVLDVVQSIFLIVCGLKTRVAPGITVAKSPSVIISYLRSVLFTLQKGRVLPKVNNCV
jgi:hypothetical protein